MILIKVGGGKETNWDDVVSNISEIQEKIILVHGASKIRDEIAEKLGHPTQTITSPSGISSVFTDKEALDIFLMVYPGLIKKTIVGRLQKRGINAIGLSGVDGRLWEGKRKDRVPVKQGDKIMMKDGNYAGSVEKVNVELINLLINNNYLPVITAPAISYEGEIINTDNDMAIAKMTEALKIKKMVILFEAPGFLKNSQSESSLIKNIPIKEVDEYFKYADGRMKKKIMGVKAAIKSGVEEIYFGDSRINNPIKSALAGEGTVIK